MSSRKYTYEKMAKVVKESHSYSDVCRAFNAKPSTGSQGYIKSVIKKFNIDCSHFKGQAWSKGIVSNKRKLPKDILCILPQGSHRAKAHHLRRALIESGVHHTCDVCGIGDTWLDEPLVLQVDHIDGNYLNNMIDNLRFLCPNCHSQTQTFGSKIIGK